MNIFHVEKLDIWFNGIISIVYLITVFVSLAWHPGVVILLIEAVAALVVNAYIHWVKKVVQKKSLQEEIDCDILRPTLLK